MTYFLGWLNNLTLFAEGFDIVDIPNDSKCGG